MTDENQDGDVVLDLFGKPVEPLRERRGRPRFAKTEENQRDVSLMVAAGWSQGRIAALMGCDEKTLRKHFSRELAGGRDMIEFQCLQGLERRAREGHTPSIKALLDQVDKSRISPPQQTRPKDEPLGKKEQAARDAADVPDGWAGALPEQLH